MTTRRVKAEIEKGVRIQDAATRLKRLKQMFMWGEATIADLEFAKAELAEVQA